MNKKLIGSVCLVAGTAIGAGMLALPRTLAKLGLLPTLGLMIFVWLIMYYSALVNLELNLRAKKGLPLGALGFFYSGRIAQIIGSVSLLLLTYSLLSAYLYGGSSILQSLLEQSLSERPQFFGTLTLYTLGLTCILAFALSYVEKVNSLLFIGLLIVVGSMIVSLISQAHTTHIPLIETTSSHISSWTIVLPTLFTSFGFQVIFHTLTDYCDKNPRVLKRAFFWGSLIPLLVYIAWTLGVIGTLHSYNPAFYNKIIQGNVQVGELVEALSCITAWQHAQLLVWIISLLAIVTSAIGVSLGLMDAWKSKVSYFSQKESYFKHLGVLLITILPAYLVALLVPNAFIKILGFAGMILVVIAIFLPFYLLWKSSQKQELFFYPILKSKTLQFIALLFGISIVLCEIMNIWR